jgi:hypothetical protein
MQKSGVMRYKCRSCGMAVFGPHVDFLDTAILNALYEPNIILVRDGVKFGKITFHKCGLRGQFCGVADLVGGDYDEDGV